MKWFARRLVSMLPRRVKCALRPAYSLCVGRRSDSPSGLAIERVSGYDVAFRKGTADERVIAQSFEKDIFFSSLPEYSPGAQDVIVDVGAHIGLFSLLAASKVPHGSVHAIEASCDSFNLLRINASLNGASNIVPHHLALSERNGMCILFHSEGNWEHSTVKQFSRKCEEVPCSTLADFFAANHIVTCHLLKLNCEGGEFPILLNADRECLQRCKVILALYHCDMWLKNSEDDLVTHLADNGFVTTIRKRTQKRGWIVGVNAARCEPVVDI